MQITTKRPGIKTRPDRVVLVPQKDLKVFVSLCFALIWLEQPKGEIFIGKAEHLVGKYQKMT